MSENYSRTMLLTVKPVHPIISLLYDVSCPQGRDMEHVFVYKNKTDAILRLNMEASH